MPELKTAKERVEIDKDFYRSSDTPKNALQPGMRLWANAIGLRFDPYRSCSSRCHYCFARVLTDSMHQRNKGTPLDPRMCRPADMRATQRQFDAIFEEGNLRPYDWAAWALSKRFFVETGCLGEPMQAADLKYRVTWNLLSLLQKYGVPLYLNTKGNLLVADESYYQQFMKVPIKIVDCSLISMDDEALRKVDVKAPLASERLALMARLKRDGVPVVVSLRPVIKGISDIDWEGFIRRLVDIGVDSIHMRTLILVGKLLKVPKWKRHAEEHMQHFSGEWRYPKDYFVDLFWKAVKVCEGSNTKLVGTRRYWFDLAGYHGKAAYDYMPQEIQDHLFPYTIVPIFRTVKQRQNEPQLMLWSNLGYSRTDVPTLFIGGYQDMLIFNDCFTRRFRKRHLISGDDYLRLGLWEGFVPKEKRPAGELSNTERIYAVVDESGSTMFDDAGHSMMAYVPPALKGELVREYEHPRREAVLWDDARGFLVPERTQMVVPPVDPKYTIGEDFEEGSGEG